MNVGAQARRAVDAGRIVILVIAGEACLDPPLKLNARDTLAPRRTIRRRETRREIAQRGNFRYTTTFIGQGGRELATSVENPAVFELTEDVGYVRAKVVNSRGDVAWTQPIFVEEG